MSVSDLSVLAAAVDRDGFAVVEDAVESSVVDELLDALPSTGTQAGLRNLLANQPAVRTLARSSVVRGIANAALGSGSFAVRAILFDKTPETNWKVTWHQDLSIAVCERGNFDGFTAWSEKEGVVHVQPPIEVLQRMLAVRVHLDDCQTENGPLRVLPGSHRDGRLDASAVDRWKANVSEVECVVGRCGLVLMRPLLLHASSSARAAGHRRVLHLDFAANDLPGGLEWHDRC